MGIIEKGYLGGFTGKLGTAIGSNWKGKSVIRSRGPRKRRGPASELQLVVQAKFQLMSEFLRPLDNFFNVIFKKSANSEMTGYNKAFSVNADFITGEMPDFKIDYPNILLSKGTLLNVGSPTAASNAAGKIQFNWADNSGKMKALISDVVYVAAFNEALKLWHVDEKIATRSSLTALLDMPELTGKPVHTWIGVRSADGKSIARSLYTGVVNVV